MQVGPVGADAGALPIQRPDVELAPPMPVPVLVLKRSSGDVPEDYRLEIDQDGSARFLGLCNVCITGELTMQVSSATIDQAKRLVRESRVFDRPMPRCSRTVVDDSGFEIYVGAPLPGKTVRAELSCGERRAVTKLALALENLLDVNGWIRPTDQNGRCHR